VRLQTARKAWQERVFTFNHSATQIVLPTGGLKASGHVEGNLDAGGTTSGNTEV
jgi:hypothetical protein